MQPASDLSLKRPRLSDAVTGRLIDLMIETPWNPGDTIPSEAELAKLFNVSKPVIREALYHLASLGVLEIRQGKSTTVRSLSPQPLQLFFRLAMHRSLQGLREALQLRRLLETQIASLAARHITDQEIEELQSILSDLKANVEQLDPWVEADVAFHIALARSAKNQLCLYLVEALAGLFAESIRSLHAQRDLRDSKATVQRHVNIFEAVARRDTEGAERAMREHFDATEPVLIAMMERQRRRGNLLEKR